MLERIVLENCPKHGMCTKNSYEMLIGCLVSWDKMGQVGQSESDDISVFVVKTKELL